ncbi:ATP-binding protein [Nocardiopsis sp. CC223A]|uniref:ATP-binding protein n=1 Tax=Nocardiopsis sp. CC223A TaxID=3044051 RepID=UPI00278C4C22|nr:ATP-binding protein [Nocardiopsis sp. CC223A]
MAAAVMQALHQARRTFPGGDMVTVGAARRWVEDHLREWDVEAPDLLTLIVSELVTNALTHTRSGIPGENVTLRLYVHSDYIRVAVKDAGPKPRRVPRRRSPEDTSTHGRGLLLVDALSLRWGPLTVGTGVFAEVAR